MKEQHTDGLSGMDAAKRYLDGDVPGINDTLVKEQRAYNRRNKVLAADNVRPYPNRGEE